MKFTISIVGLGFSGNAILSAFLKNLDEVERIGLRVIINIYEKSNSHGAGNSYDISNEDGLINRPISYMSLHHDKLNDFLRWIKEKIKITNSVVENKIDIENEKFEKYIPRKYFGMYLEENLFKIITLMQKKGIIVNIINKKIKNVTQIRNKFFLTDENEKRHNADYVIISNGNLEPKNIFELSSKNYISKIYYDSKNLRSIQENDDVLILGTSLTAMDAILALKNIGHKGKIYCYSRTGIMPSIRKSHTNVPLKYLTKENVEKCESKNLYSFLKLFRNEVKIYNSDWRDIFRHKTKLNYENLYKNIYHNDGNKIVSSINAIKTILSSTNEIIELIWDYLPKDEKIKFYSTFYPIWMSLRNPMPESSALKIMDFIKENKLIFVDEKINKITEIEDDKNENKEFIIRSNKNFDNLKIKWVINATGSNKNILEEELYSSMHNNGILSVNSLNGVLVDTKNQSSIDSSGYLVESLKIIGASTFGTYLNINSAEMISKKASDIASDLNKLIREISNNIHFSNKNVDSKYIYNSYKENNDYIF